MRLRSAFILPSALVILACRSASPAGPTELVHGLQSRMSPEEVQDALGTSGESWKVLEENPARRTLRVEVRKFQHLGVEGRLVLGFFDKQLVRERFHPSEATLFLRTLEEKEGLALAFGQSVEREPGTRITLARDGDGGAFLVWEDRDLAAEEELARRH